MTRTTRAWVAFCDSCALLLTRMLETPQLSWDEQWTQAMDAANEHARTRDEQTRRLRVHSYSAHIQTCSCGRMGRLNEEGKCRTCA